MSEPNKTDKPAEKTTADMAVELAKAQIQRDQATTLLRRRQDEQKLQDDAEKSVLIVEISQDSRGFLNRNALSNCNLDQLRLAKTIFKKLREQSQDKYVESLKADDTKGTFRKLTVGEWDPERKEWKQ